ncbi:MAG TPA: BTAD domain-containing putative transcriptional regulator, partial [Bradyrhizobium sp.]
ELYRGEFLSDLKLDAEEFETWRRQEAERLRATAAHVLNLRIRLDDECGAGERAVEAAERLVDIEPTREDWQRTALTMWARHRGREAALGRATAFTDLLRRELDVAPNKQTNALIRAIESGEVGAAPARSSSADAEPIEDTTTRITAGPVTPDATAPIILPPATSWRSRWNLRVAAIGAMLLALFVVGLAATLRSRSAGVEPAQGSQVAAEPARLAKNAAVSIAVLPFTVDGADAASRTFTDALTHDLTGYLAHYPQVHVVSDQSSASYRGGLSDIPKIRTELGAPYAIVGRVHTNDGQFQISFQLVDTASHLDVWSNQVHREPIDPGQAADEVARGVARAFAMQVTYAEARRSQGDADGKDKIEQIVLRARAAEQVGPWPANLSEAARLFEQALRLNPHYPPAMVGTARVAVMANGNLVDLDPPADLEQAKRLLQEVLSRNPGNQSAHYVLGQVESEQAHYELAIGSFERALQLNPAAIFAHAHIGHLLTLLGHPREGLERIQQYIRLGDSDPSLGYAELYAAESELELGDPRAALDWTQRANAFFPGAPRFEAWLAALYEITGDHANAARHAEAFRQAAPAAAARIVDPQKIAQLEPLTIPEAILNGLRTALAASRG